MRSYQGSMRESTPPLPAIILAVERGDYAGVLAALAENPDAIHTVDGPVRLLW